MMLDWFCQLGDQCKPTAYNKMIIVSKEYPNLKPLYGRFLEPWRLKLRWLNYTFHAKNFVRKLFDLFLVILGHSCLKCVPQAENTKIQ